MSTKPATALLAAAQVRDPFPEQTRTRAERGGTGSEINVSGNQVLLVLAIAFISINGLVWALVRHWLFKP